ncbi:hypothetical protein [Kitasatospora sp. NPDC017646]|uniref:hypothetical protein n=1 Tax=Kitasatospora sp. NPDC017646 TaxID=3364024 RepID=UPI0037A5C666
MRTVGYTTFTDQLRVLATDVTRGAWGRVEQDVHAALNGQAAEQLRALVPLQVRREEGAFFSGGEVRSKFSDLIGNDGRNDQSLGYWDPTCGAGDLLLAAASQLPKGPSLEQTLRQWGSLLRGEDLQSPFVEVARLRLFLAAAARHGEQGVRSDVRVEAGLRAFRRVRVADGLASLRSTSGYQGHLLLNPPYGSVPASDGCDWATGAVSQAAVFTLAGAQALGLGQRLSAILPDVLRSGARYEAWRARLEAVLNVKHVDLYGQFDAHTDIDVFLLDGSRRRRVSAPTSCGLWWPDPIAKASLEDAFEIRVGTVVDNRDPHDGPEVAFLTARDLADVEAGRSLARTRQFAGRLVAPPFVAIRRTSRPGPGAGGAARAAGVIVTGRTPVAVDNHLITAKPTVGGVKECRRLLKVLSSAEVSEWLDQRIRCRHLTVGVVRALPWPPNAPRSQPAST